MRASFCRPLTGAYTPSSPRPGAHAPGYLLSPFQGLLDLAVMTVILCGIAGCPPFRDPSFPEPILRKTEPESGAEYLLYVPSTYDRAKAWPLIVLCHGANMWDSPRSSIQEWVKLAEEKGFIAAAPSLRGTGGGLSQAADKQIERQRDDERLILDVVRHLRGGYTVSEDRIFLCGGAGGGHVVLYTGLKHPDLFRGLAMLRGDFDAAFLSSVADRIDPYQPVFVLYRPVDPIVGGQGPACVVWLHQHGAAVTEEIAGGQPTSGAKSAFEFFEQVVRRVPWLHIHAIQDESDRPRTVRFKTLGSFTPERFDWSFGDGETSPIASPVHTYAAAGEFEVTLRATLPDGKQQVRRTLRLVVP